ncbi:MAG: hypothetical protein C4523_11165 [Myxococcales bacterium]|nr:MAG: hypothetical protein C4523_11165 [Myxococcales bacterium]
MSKAFLIILMAGLVVGWPTELMAFPLGATPPWGFSFQKVSLLERGLTRVAPDNPHATPKGQARFCKDESFEGHPLRVYFLFAGNRLVELEYDFKRPDDALLDKILRHLTKVWGPAKTAKDGGFPKGNLFNERRYLDYLWETPSNRANLRYTTSLFIDGPQVYALHITLRPVSLSAASAPFSLLSTEERAGAKSREVTIAFTGLWSVPSDTEMAAAEGNAETAYRKLLSPILRKLAGAALAVAPLSRVPFPANGTWARGLHANGFGLVSLAHPGLYGEDHGALGQILAMAESGGMKTVGAGKNKAEAIKPVFLDLGGMRFAFLAVDLTFQKPPAKDGASPALATFADRETAAPELAKRVADLAGQVDHVVVLLMWGPMTDRCPTPFMRLVGDEILRAGARLVVGFAEGKLLPAMGYGGSEILFSAGELFPISTTGAEAEYTSLIFKATFAPGKLAGYDIISVLSRKDQSGAWNLALPDAAQRRRIEKSIPMMGPDCK